MYRLTIYENDGEKTVDEYPQDDIGLLRSVIGDAMNDLENRAITSFVVSRVSKGSYKKPFLEK